MKNDIPEDDLNLAAKAILNDFEISEPNRRSLGREDIQRLVRHLSRYRFPLVYTAFDGDHFALATEMRRYCISKSAIPVNPESILGYYETVSARSTKQGVLQDDLALLAKCQELWIFTDVGGDLSSLTGLAEGVLIELCFYLLVADVPKIAFVPLKQLLLRERVDPLYCEWDADEVLSALGERLRGDILGFLGGENLTAVQPMPSVWFAIIDLLDSKYARWIRPHTLENNIVTVVPGLAIDVSDPLWVSDQLGCLLVSWLHLMELADQALVVSPMDSKRGMGSVQRTLIGHWKAKVGKPIDEVTWKEFGVPKMLLGTAWSITHHDR